MIGYIYCATCLTTGKLYFGQTIRLVKERWERHIQESRSGSNYKFHRAIRKYGEENFLVEEVMFVEAPTKETLKAKLDFIEMRLIRKFDTFRNGYNMTLGGEGQFGRIFSEESRRKMSESAKKRCDENFRKRQSLIAKSLWKDGEFKNKHSENQRNLFKRKDVQKKLGESRRGIEFSEIHRRKIGDAVRGERNGMFGKKQSQEAIMASSTKVFQFNSNGEFIKEFISISEVKRKFGIGKKILKRNIKNGTPVMGLIWKYER